MDKNVYAFIICMNGKTSSCFGLNNEERKLLSHVLDNLNIDYNIYTLLQEVTNNKNDDNEFVSNRKNYNVFPDTIGLILQDFIKFVCDFKGHKIGIGEALIRKFIYEKVDY